ncbi:MAG: polysaccharide biosynthesis protein [Ponticaulis sp.]|nr:polysaccharide biosynthesis protein [Ponticaulis sp.]
MIRHLFGYLPVNLVAAIVQFGTVFAYTRLLDADEYGRYALALSTMHLLHTFTLTWVEAAGYRFNGEANANGTLPVHYRTTMVLSTFSIMPAFLALGIVWFMVANAPEFQSILPWLLVLMPVSVIANIAQQNHKASQRIKRYSMVEMGRVAGGFILGTLLAAFSGLGAAAPLVGITIAYAIAGLSEGIWLFRHSQNAPVHRENAKRYLAYGLPIAAALVLDLILSASDRFLIAFFIDEAAVGAYAAGYGVADKTTLMICAWAAMAGSPLLMAAYEQHGKEETEKAARGMAQSILLIALPAAVGIAIVAGPLSEVMIGEDLREQARKIIPWIAAAGFFNGLLIHYFSEAFQLARKTAQRAILMLIPALANIGLNIVLLPRIGLMGAVYATVACYVMGVVLLAVFGRKHVRLPIPVMDLAKILAACIAMAGAVQIVPAIGGLVELALKAGTGGLVYALCVVSLNAAGARSMAGKILTRIRSRNQDEQIV